MLFCIVENNVFMAYSIAIISTETTRNTTACLVKEKNEARGLRLEIVLFVLHNMYLLLLFQKGSRTAATSNRVANARGRAELHEVFVD